MTPHSEDAFVREVDEELRRAQLTTAWQRYGRIMVAVIVAGLLAFGGYLYWQHQRARQSGERGEALTRALQDIGEGREADGLKALDTLSAADDESYAAAARLASASARLAASDLKGAVAGFKSVADDAGAPQAFRDLALIRQTTTEFDSLPPQVVIARMKPLAVAGNPWFGSAGELTAIAHLKLDQPARAGPIFAAIARDESFPETLRARATRMAGVLGIDAVAAPKPAAKD